METKEEAKITFIYGVPLTKEVLEVFSSLEEAKEKGFNLLGQTGYFGTMLSSFSNNDPLKVVPAISTQALAGERQRVEEKISLLDEKIKKVLPLPGVYPIWS